MAKDYGKRRPVRQKSGMPKQLLWLVASFLGGYLTATAFDLGSISRWINAHWLTKLSPNPPAQITAKEPELPKPKFEFYTLLAKDRPASPSPNRHAVPVQTKPVITAGTTFTKQPAPNTAAAPNKPDIIPKELYQIQIASFKNKQDAEQMRAVLTLKGFDVNIAVTTQQHINWYRVIVGPFSSRIAAEKAQLEIAQSERTKGMIRKMNA